MGTTSRFGLPYPEGNGLVIQGDDAIQALAEAVDADLGAVADAPPAWCNGSAEPFVAIGAGITVELPVGDGSGHFTTPGGGFIQYTGPTRLFWFSATVTIDTLTVGRQIVSLYHESTPMIITNELDDSGADRTHVLTCALVLNNGESFHIDAHAHSGDGTVETIRWFIASVGPAGVV